MTRPPDNTQPSAAKTRQRGAILPLFVVGMLAILVMGGLALDMSHAVLNKSRLQNAADAAALAGAQVLLGSTSTALATTAAQTTFANNLAAAGNNELLSNLSANGALTVQFSATLDPFSPGTTPAEYIRVRVQSFSMTAWLIQLIGINNKRVGVSAVSGPSPTLGQVCDIVPLIVCGDPAAGGPLWGYNQGDVTVLKGSSQSGSQSGPIGPGNFQLARLGGSGKDVVRENLAGGFEGCADLNGVIPTETGVATGPTAQGINTRLDDFAGPISDDGTYKSDVITEQQGTDLQYDDDTGTVTLDNGNIIVNDTNDLDFNYEDYSARLASGTYDVPPPEGEFGRRNLTVVIANCTGKNTGQTDLPILGFGCYFMLQDVMQKGNEAEIYGEFLQDCDATGNVGPTPVDVPGPYKIQLYKDPDSVDS